MNIWDSVHRGLDKASREAARIGRAQRLRSTIDGLTKQLANNDTTLVHMALELFAAGKLTQSELIPVCQEISNLQHQLEQAQNELKLLLSQGTPVPSTPAQNGPSTYPINSPYGTPNAPIDPTLLASSTIPSSYQSSYVETQAVPPPPPGYQPAYLDATQATPPLPGVEGNALPPTQVAPPPPGMEAPTIGSLDTLPPQEQTPTGKKRCPLCGTLVDANNAFCSECGNPLRDESADHLPTMRGGTIEQIYAPGQETVRSSSSSEEEPHIADQETVRGELPSEVQPDQREGGS